MRTFPHARSTDQAENRVMFERRDQTDIIFSILATIRNGNPGASRTRILYRSNLSHSQLKTYLRLLLENELIKKKKTDNRLTYHITDRGEEAIRIYERIMLLLAKES